MDVLLSLWKGTMKPKSHIGSRLRLLACDESEAAPNRKLETVQLAAQMPKQDRAADIVTLAAEGYAVSHLRELAAELSSCRKLETTRFIN